MLLRPVGKDYIWGGKRLYKEYGKKLNMNPLAETWECSVHPDGVSTVWSGRYKGYMLDEVLKLHPEYMGTKVGNSFPILAKFIDAKSNLSVQVHPDDDYARAHENQNGKIEMWYVLDALPGASIVCGFAHKVSIAQLKVAIESNTLDRHLQKVNVRKGDVFLIPPGTVHAIGAGVLLAEIQESSNVTYRVYDYGRIGKDGKQRELHFEKAAEVMNMMPETDVRQKSRMVHYYTSCSREMLCRCKYFEVERIQTTIGCSFTVLDTSFQIIMCIDGEGSIETVGMEPPLLFRKGDCMFIPAGMGNCHIIGKSVFLKVRC